MSKTKGSGLKKPKAPDDRKLHFIVVPLEPTEITCGRATLWAIDEAIVDCVPGRVFALGASPVGSKKMTHVAAQIFQASETIPALPPAGAIRGRITGSGKTYIFSFSEEPPESGKLVDRRVPGARKGVVNVLVTWARFNGSPKWIRCLREREFFGVKAP
jgi:hypothetical protein